MLPTPAPGDPPLLGLAVFLVYLVLERLVELRISARHARVLRARGAVERGTEHFPWIVALHVLFPLTLVAEVLWGGARPGSNWWVWLILFVAAQGLRFTAIRTLGIYWNVRILVVPGMSPVRHGPYRWLKHPNYVAVALECLAAPMMFGAWRTALAISLLDAVALSVRIRAEEQALDWATAKRAPSQSPD